MSLSRKFKRRSKLEERVFDARVNREAVKIAAEKKKSLPKIETCRTIKLKITLKRRCWKKRHWKSKAKIAKF